MITAQTLFQYRYDTWYACAHRKDNAITFFFSYDIFDVSAAYLAAMWSLILLPS